MILPPLVNHFRSLQQHSMNYHPCSGVQACTKIAIQGKQACTKIAIQGKQACTKIAILRPGDHLYNAVCAYSKKP